jgi:hypothetical protein
MWALWRADADTQAKNAPYIPPDIPDLEDAQAQLCHGSASISSLSSPAHSDSRPKALPAGRPRDAGPDNTPADVQFEVDSGVQELSADSGRNLDLLGVVNEEAASTPNNAWHKYMDSDSVTGPSPRPSHLCTPTHDNVLYRLLSMNDSDDGSASRISAPAAAEGARPVAPVLADSSRLDAPGTECATSERIQHCQTGRIDPETGSGGFSSEDLSVSAISDSNGSSAHPSP